MAEDALARVESGFRTMYFKVGFAPDIDEARVRAMREAVGDGPRIRVDANAAWSPGARAADAAPPRGLRPRVRRAADAGRRSRRAGAPAGALPGADPGARVEPVARGHAGRDAAAEAADAVQLDPRFDAGIAGARTAAQVAESAGLPVVTHTFGETGVGTALMLQFHAAHRNFVLDYQTYYPNLTDDVIAGGPLRVRRLLPRRADRARVSASISTASASRTTRRTTRARWPAAARRRRTIPTTTATT